MFFIIALGLLSESISHFDREITRLYDTTIVLGEVRKTDPMSSNSQTIIMRNDIRRITADSLTDSGLLQYIYAEAGFPLMYLINSYDDADGHLPGGIAGGNWDWDVWLNDYVAVLYGSITGHNTRNDALLTFNDFTGFMAEHGDENDADRLDLITSAQLQELLTIWVEDLLTIAVAGQPLEIVFAPGYSKDDFIYSDHSMQTPIPVILSALTMYNRGLSPGDTAYIGNGENTASPFFIREDQLFEVVVIGVHNGGIELPNARNATLLPLFALEQMRGSRLGYITFRFEIDTRLNREMAEIREELHEIARNHYQTYSLRMNAVIYDEELMLVVGRMEQNLTILETLYPIAIVFSLLTGGGLSALLMFQNAKTAAIMRVQGSAKLRTVTVLCIESLAVAFLGILPGLCVLPILRFAFAAESISIAALYLSATAIGAVTGSLIISNRSPLTLLQIKE
jgi:hypothetical protein